ncbi:L-serine ammonia-lyase, iron-sulfur-dependent, subunit alpha (plasmid) [Photobacterium sp. DA100]|uniref:L-cysteine desulfidase family protein n=1 Tax=Photobacterium sp. DA100 TaxID=3027472 RepID=UPI00247A8E1F|nr:L-serine ammonia-lyase, iron-sulfur-dependent, subunit alpha [Photobacterium sp. DA100]WEM44405.1 L-serine ammonia-lyase, iron-sulfur-dependent, subunit alpha [Photobacterium sp. DA100]
MKKHLWNGFVETVQREVVPALGCTEPVSVALAAAVATRELNLAPTKIDAYVSPNLMKNGMGVGVPGTGMVGLPIAAAVGALAGDADAGLEVLRNITSQDVASAKAMLDTGVVSVGVADVSNILFAKVTVTSGDDSVTVIIADSHTRIVSIEKNGQPLFIADQADSSQVPARENIFEQATAQDIFEFALNAPLEDIDFISQAYSLNDELSKEGLTGKYGLQIGATFQRNVDRGLLSGGLLTDILRRTSAASDARMDGAMKPAMSNSGSGNQGIAATMPVVVVAEHVKADHETTVRALMMSHLMAIYIKSYQNKLSALCGATTASMGAVAGMTWLLGGQFRHISNAICSMIGDITGIICDGAKTSCAMKVSSSASAAIKAALMALDGIRVTGNEGIVADDVDASIRNMSALANGAMTQTDVQILEIMVHK